jgi:transposase
MARPISIDVRERVISAYLEGAGSYSEVSQLFKIGESTLTRWLRRARQGMSLEPDTAPGRAPKLDDHGRAVLRELVEADSDATLAELADRVRERIGVTISTPALCVTLDKMGLTRKKKTSFVSPAWSGACGARG